MFEMNNNQKALFDALTSLQKEISLNSISGMNDIDAYKNSKGKARTEKAMRSSAGQILSNLDVSKFIDSMANHIVNPFIMSRDEMLEDLTLVARVITPDLAKDGIASLSELKNGFDVKLKAMKQLADLAGYEAPKKIETKSVNVEIPSDASPEEAAKIYNELMN